MPHTKRHKNFATWAGAVKEWNKHQAFKDELYGIPRKGSSFYDEVFEMFYAKPEKVEVEAAPKVEAKVETKVEPENKMNNLREKTLSAKEGDIIDVYGKQYYVAKVRNQFNLIGYPIVNDKPLKSKKRGISQDNGKWRMATIVKGDLVE